MKIIADGDKYFEPAVLQAAYAQPVDSYRTVVHFSPKVFLELAKGIYKPSEKKYGRTEALFEKGVQFNEIPYLRCLTLKNGDLLVIAHEGRHRAMNLKKAGIKLMPVIIVSEHGMTKNGSEPLRPYRWGLTKSRPKRIHGQTGNYAPFPVAETVKT